MSALIDKFIARMSLEKRTRVLAFGSSNTERRISGMTWFDCFELAVKEKYGRPHTCINTGIGGDTSRGLLERFEDDAALYKPHMAFLTIGGNDSSPHKNLDAVEFRKNLMELYRRFNAIGCELVFQTYYSPTLELCDTGHIKTFYHYSDIVRETAAETNSELIDHLVRWERLRKKHNDVYMNLMLDAFHVEPIGNKVMGLDIARRFDLGFVPGKREDWNQALAVQKLMDELENNA